MTAEMQKVTAIIPAFNEEESIERAIRSVLWADEVLVVDSFSTDQTVDIAKKYNCRILQHEYINSATQKNWTIPQASHSWVFLLDADESCTDALRIEIQNILKNKAGHDAYWIYRNNYFMGSRIRFSGWQHDGVIRFFKRDTCRYQDLHVHAEVETTGTVGKLKGRINHYTYKNYHQYAEKFERYSTWSAKDRIKRTKKVTLYHLAFKPLFRFFKQYILKLGILDGKTGFILCYMASYSVFLRYLKVWRMMNNEKF